MKFVPFQNDDTLCNDILCPNKPHIPLLFVVDTAGSMHGEPIRSLEIGINKLCKLLSESELAKVIDLAIISFSDHAEIVGPFSPSSVEYEIALTAYGITSLQDGLQTALHEVYKRKRKYMELGVQYYKPKIILITDCNFVDSLSVVQNMVENQTINNKISLFAIGLPGCNNNILQAITKYVVNIDNYDMDELFYYLGHEFIYHHQNPGQNPGQNPELPQNVHVVPFDEW